MSRLLEILGRAITIDTADLIWHWLNVAQPGRADSDNAQLQQLGKVIDLLGDKKLEAAQEQLRLYLFENPSCIYGRMAAVAICLSKNQLQQAIEELNSVYLRQPNNTMALYALGHCYERLGSQAQAVEFYQDCLKFKNYLQLPRQRLAAIYFKNSQLEKTIEEYQLLRREYPDDISSLVTLGHLYIAVGRYEDAFGALSAAILIHPDNFNIVDNDADRLIAAGQLDEALERIEDLLQDQPERPELIAKHADVLAMLGATSQAAGRYEEAIRICPGFLEATIKLGTQYLYLESEHLAAQQFNRAVELNDQIVDAYIGLAITHKLSGSIGEALTTLSLSAAIDANSSLLFAQTAGLQFKAGSASPRTSYNDANDAAELIELVIDAHQQELICRPHNPDLHYRLGVLMMHIGRFNEACEAFEKALEINPVYSRARNKLAICLFETDRKGLALEKLVGPESLDKETLERYYKTAILYCDKVKFASSLINLDRLMEDNFASTDAAGNISIVLQNLGLLDRAAVMWDNLSDTVNQALNSNYWF